MRLLAIGDIHGCADALDALLEAVGLRFGDTLVTLGDYVDRGPDSRGVLRRLRELAARDDLSLVPILGNHDQMMLDARRDPAAGKDWLTHYGVKTLASYDLTPGDLDQVPAEDWAFLESCRPYYSSERFLFVHANAYPDLALDEQPEFMLRWESILSSSGGPHSSGKTLVCGHTSQKSGEVLNLGHAICLDTHACGGGWLSCFDTASRQLWQTNQAGELRRGWVD